MNDLPTAVPIEAVLSQRSSPPRLSFVRDVALMYHRNAWLFLKMLLPAAIFGYFAIYLCTARANEIGATLPRGLAMLDHKAELLEMTAYRWGGYVADWIFYCFAFGAITVAVRKLANGEQADVEDCFQPVRERVLPFLLLSFLLLLITFVACGIFLAVFTFVQIRFPVTFHWMLFNRLVTGLVILFPGILIASRFGLAIPALILEGCSILKSFFRSDELTEGCWTILAILLLESVFGSFLVFVVPQWLVALAYSHSYAPWWLSWAATIVGLFLGVLLQPHMLVGFALLQIRRADATRPKSRAEQIGY